MSFEPLWQGNTVNTGVPCPKVPMHRKLGLYGKRRHEARKGEGDDQAGSAEPHKSLFTVDLADIGTHGDLLMVSDALLRVPLPPFFPSRTAEGAEPLIHLAFSPDKALLAGFSSSFPNSHFQCSQGTMTTDTLISLTRGTVNTPHPAMQAERVVREERCRKKRRFLRRQDE